MINLYTDIEILEAGNFYNLNVNGMVKDAHDYFVSNIIKLKKKNTDDYSKSKSPEWKEALSTYKQKVKIGKAEQMQMVEAEYPDYIRSRSTWYREHLNKEIPIAKAFQVNCQAYYRLYIKDFNDVEN